MAREGALCSWERKVLCSWEGKNYGREKVSSLISEAILQGRTILTINKMFLLNQKVI
jgi:hypothetical protein